MKTCNKCGIPKKLSEYYRSKNKCKDCCREYQNGRTIKTNGLSTGAQCGVGWGTQACYFLSLCKHNVMVKEVDWQPYCFVSSEDHEAYVNEYGR